MTTALPILPVKTKRGIWTGPTPTQSKHRGLKTPLSQKLGSHIKKQPTFEKLKVSKVASQETLIYFMTCFVGRVIR